MLMLVIENVKTSEIIIHFFVSLTAWKMVSIAMKIVSSTRIPIRMNLKNMVSMVQTWFSTSVSGVCLVVVK